MFMPGTYEFNNGKGISFTVVISATGTLATLNAPKALTLEDFFNPDYWTEIS